MNKIEELNGNLWKGFRTESNGKQKYFYTNENTIIKFKDKPYFNKNTDSVIVYKGFETKINSDVAISGKSIYIEVVYHITNYFGDKSGMHFRNKKYVLVNNTIFQQCLYGEVKKITRMPKELRGLLNELKIRIKTSHEAGIRS